MNVVQVADKKQAIRLFFTALLSCLLFRTLYAESGVTYLLNRGRFGDHITSYINAKWVSYRYHLPLLYKKFEFSEQLQLDYQEKPFENTVGYKKTIRINNTPIPDFTESDTLYIIPYFPHYPKSIKEEFRMYPLVIDWHDHTFITILRSLISPKKPIELPVLAPEHVNIALHIRTGGGYDHMSYDNPKHMKRFFSDIGLPLNHPREEFYIHQLTWLLKYFENKKCYIYVFTDDQNPPLLCENLRNIFNKENLIFDCRKVDNKHDKNVLEDFFAMQLFDCIICPNSNYSISAAKIGNNAITIFPTAYEWHENNLIMTRVKVDIKLSELQQLVDRNLLETHNIYRLLMA